jgi:hypothetical protein
LHEHISVANLAGVASEKRRVREAINRIESSLILRGEIVPSPLLDLFEGLKRDLGLDEVIDADPDFGSWQIKGRR